MFGRCGGAKYTAALRAHFAGSRAHVPRAALWHWQASRKCWRYFYRGTKCAPRRARRSSQTTRAAPTPPQSSCSCLGGHVRNRCSLFTLPYSHAIPGAACGRIGTVLAQDWHSARRPFAPRELRMHPGVGITSHGWEPARGFDDLPHWRGAICFPNDQCQSLPRDATFEAIPGKGRRILVPPDSQVWRRWQLPN
jgi:hypothetical protein